MKNDTVCSLENRKNILDLGIPYLSDIWSLTYIANYPRPDIAFSINLIVRDSSTLTQRHWNDVKHILHYPIGAIDVGVFYSQKIDSSLLGYVDVDYFYEPHKSKSQIRYVFTCEGITRLWRSVQQSLI